jgi:hypothetical protein
MVSGKMLFLFFKPHLKSLQLKKNDFILAGVTSAHASPT